MTDIVERLLDYSKDDHERGCQGRFYDCSCGYDDKRDPLMVEAAAEIDRLRAALRGVLWMAEEWYDHGGNEDTLADDYKPALAEARAALGEKA